MKTQRVNLKPVRWAVFLLLFVFFGCGRGGGASGHRGVVTSSGRLPDPLGLMRLGHLAPDRPGLAGLRLRLPRGR